MKQHWVQELLWVKRDGNGVIIGISDKLPDSEDFIPTVPSSKEKEPMRKTRA